MHRVYLASIGLLFSLSPKAQQPLSFEQEATVFQAVGKLINSSNTTWPEDDPRQDMLTDLLISMEDYPIETGDLQGGWGQATAVDGMMSSGEPNPIVLSDNAWLPGGYFGHPVPQVSLCLLAAVLIHEGGHQDDDYPWPTPQVHDRLRYWCEEVKSHCAEIDTLDDDINMTSDPDAAEALSGRLNVVDRNKRLYDEAKHSTVIVV